LIVGPAFGGDSMTETKALLTSRFKKEERLWEEIFDPETRTASFATLDETKNKLETIDHHHIGGLDYLPINDDLLQKGAVLLPDGIQEYGTQADLLIDINQFIHRWLDITDEHRQKASWYILLSHVIDCLDTIPYLRALGDYGTGKTRYEDVIGGLCYKPMFVGGAVRSAPIYRIIDLWHGTAIFDEFTLGKSDETEDIIQILNTGYQRGKPVLRCNESLKVECFDPFGAKILACRRTFKDQALESRCITEILRETTRRDIPSDLGKPFRQERDELRRKLFLFHLRFWNRLDPDTTGIDFGPIMPRIRQSYQPFTVLFKSDPATLETFIEAVKAQNALNIVENSSTFEGIIVTSYLEMSNDGFTVITPKELRDYMVREHGAREELNERTLGKYLRPLGFTSTLERVMGKPQRVVTIKKFDLDRLMTRYIPVDSELRIKAGQAKLGNEA
jgi:hypothetical protein